MLCDPREGGVILRIIINFFLIENFLFYVINRETINKFRRRNSMEFYAESEDGKRVLIVASTKMIN
jgi:hypothetical protein